MGMMINDEKGQPVAYFAPVFILVAYSLPEKEVSVTMKWVLSLKFDYKMNPKKMVVERKTFRHK